MKIKRVRYSLHELRSQVHGLLDDKFGTHPNSMPIKYGWLKRYSPKSHMSEMSRVELEFIKSKLMGD